MTMRKMWIMIPVLSYWICYKITILDLPVSLTLLKMFRNRLFWTMKQYTALQVGWRNICTYVQCFNSIYKIIHRSIQRLSLTANDNFPSIKKSSSLWKGYHFFASMFLCSDTRTYGLCIASKKPWYICFRGKWVVIYGWDGGVREQTAGNRQKICRTSTRNHRKTNKVS